MSVTPRTPAEPEGARPPAEQRAVGRSARRLLAVLVALQGGLLVAVAVFYIIEVVIGEPRSVPGAVGILLMAGAAGFGLLLVARGLLARRRWGRSPALVTQLMIIPVALASFPTGWYIGGPLLVWAVAVIVLLFLPAVTDGFED
jgi:hypothetical protein